MSHYNAYKKSGAPIEDDEPDNRAGSQRRVVVTSAAASPSLAGQIAAASSVFALAKKTPSARGGKRSYLPPVDIGRLVFESGIEKPAHSRFSKRGDSKYGAMFDALKPGMSVELPAAYYGVVGAAARKRKNEKYTIRRVSEIACRLWRDA